MYRNSQGMVRAKLNNTFITNSECISYPRPYLDSAIIKVHVSSIKQKKYLQMEDEWETIGNPRVIPLHPILSLNDVGCLYYVFLRKIRFYSFRLPLCPKNYILMLLFEPFICVVFSTCMINPLSSAVI